MFPRLTKFRAISHDPEIYPEPFDFIPERWLDKDGQLTGAEERAAFGFGKRWPSMPQTAFAINEHEFNRECVGIHLAKSTLWLTTASILAVFDFNKAKDKHGHEIEVSHQAAGDLVQCVWYKLMCRGRPNLFLVDTLLSLRATSSRGTAERKSSWNRLSPVTEAF
jgi:hypothetical protein